MRRRGRASRGRTQYVEATYALELIGDDARGVGYLLKDRIADFATLVPDYAGPGQDRVVFHRELR